MSRFPEYGQFDATGLAELVARGEITPEALLEEAIRCRDAVNPRINAVIHDMDDIARETIRAGLPEGTFRGVPFLLKDYGAAYRGVPMTSGSRAFRDYVPDYDSEVVKRYKASGVVTFGKTNTPELALVGCTEPVLHGPTRNPWNPERTAGGSSGGSAAAVAAGIAPMAAGGDGGGSLRIPAACCGLVGFKASRGRVPHGPQGDPWYGQVQQGVLTRSVRDSARMLDAIRGPDLGAPYPEPAGGPFARSAAQAPQKLRIAWSAEPMMRDGELGAEALTGLQSSVELLRGLGHELVEAAPPLDKTQLVEGYFLRVLASVAGEVHEAQELLGRRIRHDELEDETWMLVQLGRSYSAARFDIAHNRLYRQGRIFAEFMRDYDVFLTPTLSYPAVEHGFFRVDGLEKWLAPIATRVPPGPLVGWMNILARQAQKSFDWVSATPVFNITGSPSVSLPLHWSADGLPLGMMFSARYGDDDTLFRLAGQLEREQPWFDRRPPLSGNG